MRGSTYASHTGASGPGAALEAGKGTATAPTSGPSDPGAGRQPAARVGQPWMTRPAAWPRGRTTPRGTERPASRAPHPLDRAGRGGGIRPPGATPAGGAPADPHRSPGRGQDPPRPGPGGRAAPDFSGEVWRVPLGHVTQPALVPHAPRGPWAWWGRTRPGCPSASASTPASRAPPGCWCWTTWSTSSRRRGRGGRAPRGSRPVDRRHQPGRPPALRGAAIPGAPPRPSRAVPRREPGSA